MNVEPDWADHGGVGGYSGVERTEQLARVILDLPGNEVIVGIDARSGRGGAIRRAGVGWKRIVVSCADLNSRNRWAIAAFQEPEGVVGAARRRTGAGGAGGRSGNAPNDKPVTSASAVPTAPVIIESVGQEDRTGLVGSVGYVVRLQGIDQSTTVLEAGDAPIAESSPAIDGILGQHVDHIAGEAITKAVVSAAPQVEANIDATLGGAGSPVGGVVSELREVGAHAARLLQDAVVDIPALAGIMSCADRHFNGAHIGGAIGI